MITFQSNQKTNLYISNQTNPFYNLAFEEYLATNVFLKNKIPIIFLWRNEKTIVVGKNQVAELEINLEKAKKDDVKIVRRLSGGGTVFHDLGNFCFSFIVENQKQAGNYKIFLEPIIAFLESYGIKAELFGKNDLKIEEFKISGNAQYLKQNVLVHHGTLLFDANLSLINKYLKINQIKTNTKIQRSQLSKVANIKKFLEKEIDTNIFFDSFVNFFKSYSKIEYLKINDEELIINSLKNKYEKDSWTFNHPFNLEKINSKRFDGGTITLWANIANDKIQKIIFEGDFLAILDHNLITNLFINEIFDKNNIEKILNKIDLPNFFGRITKSELLELFFIE